MSVGHTFPEDTPRALAGVPDPSLLHEFGHGVGRHSGRELGAVDDFVFIDRTALRFHPLKDFRGGCRGRYISLDTCPGKALACVGNVGSVRFFSAIAGAAGCGEILGAIVPAFAYGSDVIDLQDDIRGELSAVAAGEVIPLKNLPAAAVPIGLSEPVSHALSMHDCTILRNMQYGCKGCKGCICTGLHQRRGLGSGWVQMQCTLLRRDALLLHPTSFPEPRPAQSRAAGSLHR